MRKYLTIVSLVIIVFSMLGCSMSDKYTAKQFRQINQGMAYSDCVKILGGSGTLVSENVMPGIPDIMPSLKTSAYSWENDNGSNIMLMFQNDELISKAQAGLK